MNVVETGGVKVYNVSVGKSLPEWLKEKKKKSLRYDTDYRRRIELLQDFEFPTAANCISVSPDGQYLAAAGSYKPSLRLYEVNQLCLKCERHVDADILRFQFLSEDFSKLVLLESDRTLEFHAKYGCHYKTRIPKHGRDVKYYENTCDVYVAAASSEIYRLNLDQGRFLQPLPSSCEELSVIDISDVHGLIGVGGVEGVLECWDPRSKTRAGGVSLRPALSALNYSASDVALDKEITSLKFSPDGLSVAAGTKGGIVLSYDLRMATPIFTKDHNYGFPIKNIQYQTKTTILSADTKVLKIWDASSDGKTIANIEPPADINDVCLVPKSGLILMACEQPKMLAYFIPSLGPAPKWCSFLEGLTEELEEDKEISVYDDYKFVTREELEKLGMTKLIGTNVLRAYMHGFFMDMRLYKRVKSVVEPFEYKDYIKERVKKKMDEQASTRITVQKKAPKVNKKLAARLLQQRVEEDKKKLSGAPSILEDQRFSALFSNPAFRVDEASEDYKRTHPTESKLENFSLVDEEDASDSDEDSDTAQKQNSNTNPRGKDKAPRKRKIGVYAPSVGHGLGALETKGSNEKDAPLEKRLKTQTSSSEAHQKDSGLLNVKTSALGRNVEFSYVPASSRKKKGGDADEEPKKRFGKARKRGGKGK